MSTKAEQVAYTPGPWTSVKLTTSSTFDIRPTSGPEVATVWDCNGDNAAHCEANARLIASAPELLACLKEALELIQEDIDNRDGRDNFGMCCGNCDGAIPVEHSFGCRAKAAISKAEHGS